MTSSVMEKQSWTSIILISFLGSVMPASLYALMLHWSVVIKWSPSQLLNSHFLAAAKGQLECLDCKKVFLAISLAFSTVVTMAQAAPSLTRSNQIVPRDGRLLEPP